MSTPERTRYPELASWLRQHWHRSEDAKTMALRHHDNGGWTMREVRWAEDFRLRWEADQARFSSEEPADTPEVGFYLLGRQYFRVQRNRADTASYAKLWVGDEPGPNGERAWWRYVAREPFEFLTPGHRLTKSGAQTFGNLFGRCIVCDAELTDPKSAERGMGPVCYEKYA